MTRHISTTPLDSHGATTPAHTPRQDDFEAIYGNATPVAHPWAGLVLEHA